MKMLYVFVLSDWSWFHKMRIEGVNTVLIRGKIQNESDYVKLTLDSLL